ncbi:MAG: CARDB domain-containing protein, partial [Candidatus Nanohaloarchaea archaeon]
EGQNCETGAEKMESPNFPLTYTFDEAKSSVNDQITYTRYGVANGIRYRTLDIGANLEASSISVQKNPIYYSQEQEVSFTLTNNGNVPVTSSFQVTATITGPTGQVDSRTFTYSSGVAENGGSISESYTWDAIGQSGDYSVNLQVDSGNDITEISEADNIDSTSFELKPITLPEIFVNEEKVEKGTTTFSDPGVPYNLSLLMRNSDNDTLTNSTVRLIEKDGTSAFSPTQEVKNNSFSDVKNEVSFRVDDEGKASITIIPTGNQLLSEKYSDLNIQEALDYALQLKGEQQDGTEFKFINNGSLENYYPMSVGSPGTYDGDGTSDLPNLNNYVKLSMNGVYSIFSEFWGAVT